MTAKEALKQLNDLHTYCFLTQPEFRQMGFEFTQSFFDEVGEALEKQIPKKPNYDGQITCPCCKSKFLTLTPNYCDICGQALDWSDT